MILATVAQAAGLALVFGIVLGFWCGAGFQEFHHRQEARRRRMIARATKNTREVETR